MAGLPPKLLREAVSRALLEDVGNGDATTLATVPRSSRVSAVMRARETLVVCGLDFAEAAFRHISRGVRFERALKDGEVADPGEILLRVNGSSRAVLTAERVALNYVQRLSGIATLTRDFVSRLEGTDAKILDTRKTTPGWRVFEKYAVKCGGGTNHRVGLFDMILIKDNHLAALRDARPNSIAAAVERSRRSYPKLRVEVEADTLEQVSQAIEAGADGVLLDNMSTGELRRAVRLAKGRAFTEASGGVTLRTVAAIARTGVDYISVGALTHSASARDIGLDFSTP